VTGQHGDPVDRFDLWRKAGYSIFGWPGGPHGRAGQMEDITHILKVPDIKSRFIDYNSARLKECLPSFGAESFVFQFAIQKFK
jgi:hypothetical protein